MGAYVFLTVIGIGFVYLRSEFPKSFQKLATIVGGVCMLIGFVAIFYKIVAPIILLLICIVIAGFVVSLLIRHTAGDHNGGKY